MVTSYYRDFLLLKPSEDQWEYPDATDQVREILVHETYSSLQDIKLCAAFDVTTLNAETNYEQSEALHAALLKIYGSELEALQ